MFGRGASVGKPPEIGPAGRLALTKVASSLQFGSSLLASAVRLRGVRVVTSDEAPEGLEAVRIEKLRRIEALGLDPWGQRFDGHQAIASVRAQAPPPPSADPGEPAQPGPRARVAGRIMLRRGQGKVNFLELRDCLGDDFLEDRLVDFFVFCEASSLSSAL